LFAQYALMVDSAELFADATLLKGLVRLFPKEIINKNEIVKAVLQKSANLLTVSNVELGKVGIADYDEIIDELISDLKRQEKIQLKAISDLKKNVVELNEFYTKSLNKYREMEYFYYFINDDKKKITEAVADYSKFLYKWMNSSYDSIRMEELIKVGKFFEVEHDYENVFSSDFMMDCNLRFWKTEVSYELGRRNKSFYEGVIRLLENDNNYINEDLVPRLIESQGDAVKIEFEKIMQNVFTDCFSRYVLEIAPLVGDDVKKIFVFQKKIEQKFQEIVYGYKMPTLPDF